jgi:hypothetical protein
MVTTRCNCGTLKSFYTEEEIGDIHGCDHTGLYEVSAISIDDYNDLLMAYMAQLNDPRTSFFMFYFGDPATEEDPEDWPEGFYKMETPTYAREPTVHDTTLDPSEPVHNSQPVWRSVSQWGIPLHSMLG